MIISTGMVISDEAGGGDYGKGGMAAMMRMTTIIMIEDDGR